jgi:hypothetical protein
MTLLSLIAEGGLRESGACFERCRESPSTRMFREGQNSKATIDGVQQDDDGALEHFQQQAPGHTLHTSGVCTLPQSTVLRSVGPAIPWFTVASGRLRCHLASN